MEGIQVSTEVAGSQNQVSIIKVGGFIDTTTSSEVERALNSLLKQNRYNVVVDLGNVDYISSAGWGIFISEIKSIRERKGDLKLVRMIPDVYEIFELLEFHHILDVFDSVDEAVQKFEEIERKPAASEVVETTIRAETSVVENTPQETTFIPPKTSPVVPGFGKYETVVSDTQDKSKDLPLAMHALDYKIKYIVAQSPHLGAYKINKILNTEKYGFTRVGWFGVRSILSQLGLNSRRSRKKFAEKFSQMSV